MVMVVVIMMINNNNNDDDNKEFFCCCWFCYECVERCGVSMCVLGGKEGYEFVVNLKCGYECVGSCSLFMSVLGCAVWLCVGSFSVVISV